MVINGEGMGMMICSTKPPIKIARGPREPIPVMIFSMSRSIKENIV